MVTAVLKSRCLSPECPRTGMTLADLPRGCPGTICGFLSDDAVSRRLFDLGFVPGMIARKIRRAPLRDPLVFEVDGTQIVLRRHEAAKIVVSR